MILKDLIFPVSHLYEKCTYRIIFNWNLILDEEPVEKKSKKSKRGKRSKKGEIDENDLKTAEKIFPESVKQIEELDQEVDIVGDEELKFKYKWSQPLTFG